MYVIDVSTGENVSVDISKIQKNDLKLISKKDFFFNWKTEDVDSIYKLYREDDATILGLISISLIDNEERIHVNLLAVSKQNKGSVKKMDRIAGNLLAFAGKMAVSIYGYEAAISLVPKTDLVKHYINKYGFQPAGKSLVMLGEELIEIINQYK